MATLIKVCSGPSGVTVSGVYDDRLRPIYDALGMLKVTRASEVELDPMTGEWFAVSCETGQEIARDKNRAACIAAEVAWLEARLRRTA